MLRETLEDIGRSSFAEVHTSIALALWRASFFDEIEFSVSEGLERMWKALLCSNRDRCTGVSRQWRCLRLVLR